MQIEKPTVRVPRWAVIIGLFLAAALLSLPFLSAKHAKSQVPASEKPNDEAVALEPELNQAAAVKPEAEVPAVTEPVSPEIPEIPLEVDVQSSPALEAQSAAIAVPPPEEASSLVVVSPAVVTSYYGNVSVIGKDGKEKMAKNRKILEGETIEVGTTGEVVLEIEELYVLRLKSNSKLTQEPHEVDKAFAGKQKIKYRYRLDEGSLLGTTKYRGDKLSTLSLAIKDKVFDIQDSTFRVQATDAGPWLGVLRGSVKSDVENSGDQPVVIRALEKVSVADVNLTSPVKVSEDEWGLLRETYEMNLKTAAEEAMQLDLSKRAGDFFGFVFDHGTFYTEDVGYTVRDFYEDKASGDVYLEAEYDVFPANSFVGLYVLTRDLDARNYGGLRFEVRRKPDEGYPDRFFVELKSKGQIIHRFEITDIKPFWESRQIDFFTPVSTPITEVTLVFLNENIGQSKKGFIQMRNMQMVPLTDDQKNQRAETEKNVQRAALPSALLKEAPRSVKQAVVTETIKKARKIAPEPSESVPYKMSQGKIANETPKVVTLDDL